MTISDRLVATIRTLVPSLYGLAIAWLFAQFPFVRDAFTWLSAELGTDVSIGLSGVLTALTIAGYYWLARRIGDRYPGVEKWLLGSSLVPMYAPEVFADVNTGDVEILTRKQAREYRQAIVDDADAHR